MTVPNGDRDYPIVRGRDDVRADFRRRFHIPLTGTGRAVFEEVHACARAIEALLRTNA